MNGSIASLAWGVGWAIWFGLHLRLADKGRWKPVLVLLAADALLYAAMLHSIGSQLEGTDGSGAMAAGFVAVFGLIALLVPALTAIVVTRSKRI